MHKIWKAASNLTEINFHTFVRCIWKMIKVYKSLISKKWRCRSRHLMRIHKLFPEFKLHPGYKWYENVDSWPNGLGSHLATVTSRSQILDGVYWRGAKKRETIIHVYLDICSSIISFGFWGDAFFLHWSRTLLQNRGALGHYFFNCMCLYQGVACR